MSQWNPNQPQPHLSDPGQPEKPHKKPMSKEARIGWSILAGFAIFAFGLAVGAGTGSPPAATATDPQPTVTVTVPDYNGPTPDPVTTPTNTPETTEPTYGIPKPKDFKVGIKVLSKHCFGSAGWCTT